MDFSNAPADLIVNLFAGVVSAILVLFVVEGKRRPFLEFEVEPTIKGDRSHVRVYVKNAPMPIPLRWFYDRETATRCHAWIMFYYEDGVRVYQNEMVARWASTLEPVEPFLDESGSTKWRARNSYDLSHWVDITPNIHQLLDVAAQEGTPDKCYGWNNESYFAPDKWKLSQVRYIVRIRVQTGGRDVVGYFRLINDSDFRLEPITDKRVIRNLR